jgi:outer membrane lipoprotein-sorting protein
MKRLYGMAIILCLVCAPGAVAAELDDIVAKHLEARGGEDKIKAVESAQLTGTMTFPGAGIEAPLVFKWKSPAKFRADFTVQGMTGSQAFNGETGWQLMPFQGQTEPQPMSEEEVKQTEDEADFHGPFVDTEKKGYKLEYLGEEEVEGTQAHKIKITNKHGDETIVFLDAEYYLEIKSVSTRTMREQEITVETSSGDYKEVDGLMIAHSIEATPEGAPGGQALTFEKIELNIPIDDSEFEMPEKKAAE